MTSVSFLNSTWFVWFYDVPGALDRFCSIDFTCLSHMFFIIMWIIFFFLSRVNYKNNSYWRSDFYFIFAQKSVNSYFDCFAHCTLEVFLSIFRYSSSVGTWIQENFTNMVWFRWFCSCLLNCSSSCWNGLQFWSLSFHDLMAWGRVFPREEVCDLLLI